MTDVQEQQEIVIVTGPAGAGRMTAINGLADLGYETIDNLPLALFSRLVSGPPVGRPLAVGVDTRTRGFSVEALLNVMESLEANDGTSPTLLYLDCDPDALLRRFSETRRRHPMAQDGTATIGIELEQDLLSGLRERADIVLDTTDLSPHDLRYQLAQWFSNETSAGLSVSVQSFSYKRGIPRGVDMVIDCRFLNNPHWVPELRAFTGMDKAVADYVAKDPRFDEFFARLCDLLDLLLPGYRAEGKAYFSVAMGCTGGQHRSVCLAQALSKYLTKADWQVSTRHREMDRRIPSA